MRGVRSARHDRELGFGTAEDQSCTRDRSRGPEEASSPGRSTAPAARAPRTVCIPKSSDRWPPRVVPADARAARHHSVCPLKRFVASPA